MVDVEAAPAFQWLWVVTVCLGAGWNGPHYLFTLRREFAGDSKRAVATWNCMYTFMMSVESRYRPLMAWKSNTIQFACHAQSSALRSTGKKLRLKRRLAYHSLVVGACILVTTPSGIFVLLGNTSNDTTLREVFKNTLGNGSALPTQC